MISNHYMPTRIVAGQGALADIGGLAGEAAMRRVLVVSDRVISAQTFHATAIDALQAAGLDVTRFDDCGIDARCSHIDAQGARAREEPSAAARSRALPRASRSWPPTTRPWPNAPASAPSISRPSR